VLEEEEEKRRCASVAGALAPSAAAAGKEASFSALRDGGSGGGGSSSGRSGVRRVKERKQLGFKVTDALRFWGMRREFIRVRKHTHTHMCSLRL
jgi:hypothetical protein